ncbi:C2H2 type zinc-finger domain containing protein [Nitzschia inconspicua]|uniref:C2H2 type zinc-finger domain containing protein n=1 Tax=Nitzschia inconspicua TaxID=303405 RepID=A0A9K3LZ12_9STRA|nr:C2H2 type zinc-finger domain containing protein [Nitzschia inconspicua]
MSTEATGLTSTTAPGKIFTSRAELAEHYKSDWHKYNLKRREAGLPLLEESEFQARWEAALALRREKASQAGTDHLKNKTSSKKQSKKHQLLSTSATTTNDPTPNDEGDRAEASKRKTMPAALVASQENPEIDPHQCLFDGSRFDTLDENVEYMQRQYGFFVPDKECLADLEGLLGYCHEKIKLGHYCLYCEKVFPTWQGCQKHMISKQHTKLRYEQGYWEELDPFYDFRREDSGFLAAQKREKGKNDAMETEEPASNANAAIDDDDEDGWEDMSEGDDEENAEESEDMYGGFEKEIARFGLDVTPLGELIFPDGRVVGHRALRRYYKQNLRTNDARNTAVVAAQRAAGERIYGGQVVNIHQYNLKPDNVQGAGKGILVPIGKDGATGGFSTLSLYRYRAAVRKQRRDDEKGRRMYHKSYYAQNTNKMDKKHNRIMNGVSVAHAAR